MKCEIKTLVLTKGEDGVKKRNTQAKNTHLKTKYSKKVAAFSDFTHIICDLRQIAEILQLLRFVANSAPCALNRPGCGLLQ